MSILNQESVRSPDIAPSAPALLQHRTRRPRILFVSPHFPHRGECASELRALNIGRALQRFGDVEMVVVDGEGRQDEWAEEWAERHDQEFKVAYSVPVYSRPHDSVSKKLRGLHARAKYPHACGVDDQAMQRLLSSIGQFDLIWFCKLRTPNMFPRWAWPRSVADIDDVPSTYEQSALRNARAVRDRLLSYIRFMTWRRRDQRLGERFTVLSVCSETDKRYLQALGVKVPLHVIPNGYEQPATVTDRRRAIPPRVGFIGILDYWPNLHGIEWFVSQCWPRIIREVPAARLRLVGRLSDGPLKPEGPSIDGLGFVGDVADEIATWSAMVVPIHLGAGTRGKIAHAFSLKCPVVSTSLGAYGYDANNEDTLFLADSPEDFSEACVKAIRQPDLASQVAERAWQQFLEKWTWDAIRPRVWAAAEDCLRRNDTAAP